MKRRFLLLNAIFIAIEIFILLTYLVKGGILLKGIASAGFVIIGAINLIYAISDKTKKTVFPSLIFAGLFSSMLGDIIISFNFIIGALIFALGHVLYFIAFCKLNRFENRDTIPSMIIFIGAAALLTLTPYFDFGGNLMLGVCVFYSLIISLMAGKAISAFLKERSLLHLVILIGAVLFFFSDVMLVFNVFGGAPKIADTLCLFSYWPGQTILAFSGYLYAKK